MRIYCLEMSYKLEGIVRWVLNARKGSTSSVKSARKLFLGV